MRPLVLAGLLVLAPEAIAQPARAPAASPAASPAPRRPDDARALASQLLTRIGGPAMADQQLAAQRQSVTASFQQNGMSPAQATQIYDSYFGPEYRRRLPDLLTGFQDVLMADFTVAELRAVVDGTDNDARRSASGKSAALQAHLGDAARRWASKATTEAIETNKDELRKLGLNITGGTR